MKIELIKGAGDIASAIAHRLKKEGRAPVLLETPHAVITRRKMSLGTAIYEASAELEGIAGVRCETEEQVRQVLDDPQAIPVLIWNEEKGLPPLERLVVVDARMRKKRKPPVQIWEAPLVIGVGPGFKAGAQVHGVVESSWGEAMGQVTWEGSTLAYTGIHRKVEGHGSDRYLYAPTSGRFRTDQNHMAMVTPGQTVGHIGEIPLQVKIAGILKGLAHDGVIVEEGTKLVEVDPKAKPEGCTGIGERPGKIAQGVWKAISEGKP